jgi:catechol 2,3-dioxygenase-like lactoylglutathione lyase family enzyme
MAEGQQIENTVPILSVRDIRISVAYYDRLGFERASWGDTFTSVGRDGWGMYLCEGGQGQPGTWVWIGVNDVEALYEEFQAQAAKIILPPTNYPHALEMRVEDPNGHVLRFGSGPKEDESFEQMTV